LLLAACIGLTVVVWKSYGDVANKKITRLGTQLVLTSSLSPEEPAQPGGPALEADLPNAAPPAAPPVEIAAEAVVPAAALLMRPNCFSRWHAISQSWGMRSSNSRPAWSSSKPASNKTPRGGVFEPADQNSSDSTTISQRRDAQADDFYAASQSRRSPRPGRCYRQPALADDRG